MCQFETMLGSSKIAEFAIAKRIQLGGKKKGLSRNSVSSSNDYDEGLE